MSKPKCETCRYWEPTDTNLGVCHINPPTIIPGHPDGLWPITLGISWCGQHEEPLGEITADDVETVPNTTSTSDMRE